MKNINKNINKKMNIKSMENMNKTNNKVNNKNNDIGIYIDIPFCKSKCSYCVFPTYVIKNNDNLIEEYIKSLKYEISNYDKKIILNNENILYLKENIYKRPVSSIYIGGGTPSYINSMYVIELLKLIYSKFHILENAEITIEMNPDDIEIKMLKAFKEIGINRVSLGLQSTNNNVLSTSKRRYNFSEFKNNIMFLKKYFSNISLDIIIGLPFESISSFKNTISDISNFSFLKHISAYEYILDESSTVYNDDTLYNNLPSEKDIKEMKNILKQEMKKQGYIHYEISNYAKDKNYMAKHNYNCWNHKEYIGFGLSSASFLNGCRYRNSRKLNRYIEENNSNTKILNNNILQSATISHLDEQLNLKEFLKDLLFVKLRTANGISYTKLFKEMYTYRDNNVGNNIDNNKEKTNNKITKEEYNIIINIAKFLNKSTKDNLLLYANTSYNFDNIKIGNLEKIYNSCKNKKANIQNTKSAKNIKKKIYLMNHNSGNSETYKNGYTYICNPNYIFYGEDSVFPKILLI